MSLCALLSVLEDPELLTRHEIQAASPDLLITNYSMLEYMLLRPIERDIFTDTRAYFEAHPDEKFFLILDEAHLYRGANGTEVAYLVRRLLDRLGLPASRVVFIATSASFSNADAAATFVAGLTGLDPAAITTSSGTKRAFEPAANGSTRRLRRHWRRCRSLRSSHRRQLSDRRSLSRWSPVCPQVDRSAGHTQAERQRRRCRNCRPVSRPSYRRRAYRPKRFR